MLTIAIPHPNCPPVGYPSLHLLQVKESKFWWPLMRPAESRDAGKVWGLDGKTPPMLLVSVQLVPECLFEELPAGHGRRARRRPSRASARTEEKVE